MLLVVGHISCLCWHVIYYLIRKDFELLLERTINQQTSAYKRDKIQ